MSTSKIIAEISTPAFYMRVAFLALKAAQNVATEDPETAEHASRAAYAGRILRGEESAVLLASHVVASNSVIASAIVDGSGADVPDGDIEFALGSIWTARALAFFPPAAPPADPPAGGEE